MLFCMWAVKTAVLGRACPARRACCSFCSTCAHMSCEVHTATCTYSACADSIQRGPRSVQAMAPLWERWARARVHQKPVPEDPAFDAPICRVRLPARHHWYCLMHLLRRKNRVNRLSGSGIEVPGPEDPELVVGLLNVEIVQRASRTACAGNCRRPVAAPV